jgi:phosphate transport system substrate-binding protein
MTMHRSFTIAATATLILALAFAGCSRKGKDSPSVLQIKGSDTMVNLTQAWAEEYMKRNPGSSIAVTGGGSGTGISSLISNTCDIAQVSREMKDAEIQLARGKGIEPKKIVVALDGLAVVVHPSNPIASLTLDQLADIYTGKVTNWAQLGGTDAKIVLLSREVNSGTHVYFKEHVLRHGDAANKAEFSPEALLLPSSQAIADEATQNPNAIGYYGMGYISQKVKVVHVAKSATDPAVAPSIESVQSGAYPISRPLIMYTKGEATGLGKSFIDFVESKEGQDIVRRLDFVPIGGK